MNDEQPIIGAIILGAGQSRRMGRPKLALPWGNETIIEHIVSVLSDAQVSPIVLVTGGARAEIEKVLPNTSVIFAHNPMYASTEMLESLQIGLRTMPEQTSACLIVLGDQPQIEVKIVREVIASYRQANGSIIVPSYHMHRGHPWLVDKCHWMELQSHQSPQSLRDFLRDHSDMIHYVNVDTASVLGDLDTPEDYESARP